MAAYARVAVARSAGGFTVSGNSVVLAAIATFPACASGSGTVTYFGLGVGSSGATQLLFFGTVTPNIAVVAGIVPKLDTGTSVSNTTPDGLANAAATALLTLLFNNGAWAGVGDSSGLQPSGAAGSFYLSLHSSSPGEGGTSATNEISYS